jgi:tRNA dimethylallyltransferase
MKTLISIVGPTAVGKTSLSILLAKHYNTEIISCDSRQFYRYMDIGTAKATLAERENIPHHFLDFLNPDEEYNAGKYEREVEILLEKLFQEKEVIIIVGGSTLYINALWNGIDDIPEVKPEIRAELNQAFLDKGLQPLLDELEQNDLATYNTIDRKNHVRIIRALEVLRSTGLPISHFRTGKKHKSIDYQNIKVCLTSERELLYARIDKRVEIMLAEGLVEEVENLLKMGYSPDLSSLQAIGYKEVIDFLEEKIDRPTMISQIQQHSRNYAKRQLTWFRRDKDLMWEETGNQLEILKNIQAKIL